MSVHRQAIAAGYRCIMMILQHRLRITVILSEPADSRTPVAAVFAAFQLHEHADVTLDILLALFWGNCFHDRATFTTSAQSHHDCAR
jgi:hypothetical protein